MHLINSENFDTHMNVAIIANRGNAALNEVLLENAVERLREYHLSEDHITAVWVTGTLDIPLIAQRLAKSDIYEAIICLDTIIRDETIQYENLCYQIRQSCQQVALQHDIPVIFGVLTVDTQEIALAHANGDKGNKGREAADNAMDMVTLLRQIRHEH